MINFFRKIRKRLADDNKPLKYARYAVGEIVLVVIGILIALSINNWNERNKERIKEREILIDLAETLEINIKTLKTNIEQLKSFDRSSEIVLASLYNKRPFVDSMEVHFNRARVPKTEIFLSQTGYERNKDIGLNIVTNKDLKDEILTLFETIYPTTLASYKMVNGYLAKFDDHIVQNFIYSNIKRTKYIYSPCLCC